MQIKMSMLQRSAVPPVVGPPPRRPALAQLWQVGGLAAVITIAFLMWGSCSFKRVGTSDFVGVRIPGAAGSRQPHAVPLRAAGAGEGGWIMPPPVALDAADAYAASKYDAHLTHLVSLARELAGAQGASVADTRAAYAAALSAVSAEGVFDASAAAMAALRNSSRAQQLATQLITHALAMISHTGLDRVVRCRPDPDLPPPPAARYVIAANLHNSEAVLPNFALQLLRVVVLSMPPGDAYVSIYESGSGDATPRWLHALALLLPPVGVPSNITIAGALVRQHGQERIQYLVGVRNALVAPFFPAERDAAACAAPGAQFTAACYQPDHLLMINDVFWCPDDMVRLAQHDADIACGVDFGKFGILRRRHAAARRALLNSGASVSAMPEPALAAAAAGDAAGGAVASTASRRLATAANDQPHYQWSNLIQIDQPNYGLNNIVFYDIWVVRDTKGQRFGWNKPWADNALTAGRLAAGLPMPMHCCWNGLAKLNPAPFAGGLRFRANVEGECAASECSLLCDDYHRLGYTRVVMDPSVRVGYGFSHKWVVQDPHFNYTAATGFRTTSWADVAAASPIDWSAEDNKVDYKKIECCGKDLEGDGVDWGRCFYTDAMTPNHTATYLSACGPSIRGGGGKRSTSYTVRLNITAPCPTA